MNKKLVTRIVIDVCMTICLLLLMAYSLVGEVAHEVIGIAIFVLFVIHHILNRRWIASMVSGIILSDNIFKFVKVTGVSMLARQVHMFCAYWGFMVMSVHLGIHWNMIVNMTKKIFKNSSIVRSWIARVMAIIFASYGGYAFYKREIGGYLLMKIHFVFYDYMENVLFFVFDYVAVMGLVVFLTYYIVKMPTRRAMAIK